MTETAAAAPEQTEVGSYFVANYPPFSTWTQEAVAADALPALAQPAADVPLGLYLHIPFCRKRCHFCYYRVYTGKNASEVTEYLDLLGREWELYATQPAIAGRPLRFVYFGGGTPSFLSVRQLRGLVDRLSAVTPWTGAEEITFECEPGTLTESKLAQIRELGVTRLSLGIEHYDDRILELNGRAHRSAEVFRAYRFAQSLGFPQINIDLIAGMLGDDDAKWRAAVEQTIELDPDSVTIYQMELPYNTTISHDLLEKTGQFTEAVAGWPTKRRWVEEAFAALEERRLHRRQRLHRGQEPRRDPLRLPRPALAGGRPRAAGGRLVRARQRRAHAELRRLGTLRGRHPAGRDSPQPGLPADRRGAADPRVRAPAQARLGAAGVLPGQVRRAGAGAVRRAPRGPARRRLPDGGRPRPDRPDARRAAPGRQPAAALLPSRACRPQVHLTGPRSIRRTT